MVSFSFTFLWSCQLFAQQIQIEVVDPKQKPVADVVAYIVPLDQQDLPTTDNIIEIGQFDKSFAPYISVMQKGNTVKFSNRDDITHHIYSPLGANKFSFKIKAGQHHTKTDFDQAGVVTMGCNIHDWMSGHLLILDTPYFAKTDKKGAATIDILQQGKYQLTIWHPQLKEPENRLSLIFNSKEKQKLQLALTQAMNNIPEQSNEDDFDFLSDY